MSHPRTHIQRWCLNILLVSVLALPAFALQIAHVHAAACNNTPLDASASTTDTPVSCTMTINETVNPGAFTLTNPASAVTTPTSITLNGSDQTPTFTFPTLVSDNRGSTAGWRLQLASSGIQTPAPPTTAIANYALSITGGSTSCTIAGATCAPEATATLAATPITLTTSNQTVWSVGSLTNTTILNGDNALTTNGSFTIPATAPAGVYQGVVTVTLLNSFS